MKTCSKCCLEKSLNDFHKDSRSSDGFHSLCKECRSKKLKTKVCAKCGEEKSLSNFYKRQNSVGHQSYCIACIEKCAKKIKIEKNKKLNKIKIKVIKSNIRRHNKVVKRFGYNPYHWGIKPKEMEKLQKEIEKRENILKSML